MADRSAIEWTDASWNPIRARRTIATDPGSSAPPVLTTLTGWHCVHKSEGCRNCYAESINRRLGTQLPYKPGHEKDLEIFVQESILLQPLRWKRPRMIFVGSMTWCRGFMSPGVAMSQSRPEPICAAQGCGRSIEHWQRFCPAHWRLLPAPRRRELAEAQRDHRYLRVSTATSEAAAWLRANSPAAMAARITGEAFELPASARSERAE